MTLGRWSGLETSAFVGNSLGCQSSIDWGDVPTWIYTGLTLVIAAAAFATIWVSMIQRTSRLAEQVWVLPTKASTSAGTCTVRIHNRSDGPLYDITVKLVAGGKEDSSFYLFFEPNSVSQPDDLDFLTTIEWAGQDPRPKSLNPPLWLKFTDGTGRTWMRKPDGKLRRCCKNKQL